jgi:integrase/recombinase XerD
MKHELKNIFKEYIIFNNRCTEETALQYIEHVEKFESFAAKLGINDVLSLEVARDAHRILMEIQRAGHYRTGTPLSDSYIFKIGAMASAYFKFAIFEGIKKTPNPFENGIGIKKKQFAKPQFFDRDSEKMRMILAFPYSLRDKALLYILYASAIRRREAAHLKIADIYEDRIQTAGGDWKVYPIVRVTKGKGGKIREVPIDPLTKKYIDVYVESIRARGLHRVCAHRQKRAGKLLQRRRPEPRRHLLLLQNQKPLCLQKQFWPF